MSGLPPSTQAPTYVDIQKHWRKLGPIYRSTAAQKITVREIVASFVSREVGLRRLLHIAKQDHPSKWRFSDLDTNDWRVTRERPGRPPAHYEHWGVGMCHWQATLNYYVARRFKPQVDWRILANDKHTTVTADNVIFDPHWMAMETSAAATWECMNSQDTEDITPYLSEHGTYHDECFEETLDLLRAQGHGGLVGVITNFLSEEEEV